MCKYIHIFTRLIHVIYLHMLCLQPANITVNKEDYTTLQNLRKNQTVKLECGPMPKVMATLPNIGGTLCSMLQRLADAHY